MREVLEAGACGYLLKEDADHGLFAAVYALRRHAPFFTTKIAEWVSRDKKGSRRKRAHTLLTPRQRETIQLIAEGKTNKEVATILNISAKTVETHRANIMLKLNLHSVTDLVHYAIRNEIVHA